ncbi:heavy metal-associated domain protein, partial [Ostertagia ostertagi]
ECQRQRRRLPGGSIDSRQLLVQVSSPPLSARTNPFHSAGNFSLTVYGGVTTCLFAITQLIHLLTTMPQYTFEMAMTCDGCANAARRVLGKLGDKVTVDKIDVGTKQVVVTTDLPASDILEALKKTGKEIKQL